VVVAAAGGGGESSLSVVNSGVYAAGSFMILVAVGFFVRKFTVRAEEEE
jgi:cytochrome c biogenesis protein CcdA